MRLMGGHDCPPHETAYALRGGLALLAADGFLTDFKSSAALRSLRRVEGNFQSSVLEIRLRGVGLYAFRQRDLPAKMAVRPLAGIDAFLGRLMLAFPLAFDGHCMVRDIDSHIVLVEARQIRALSLACSGVPRDIA